jgi:hypothetical protein
MSPQQLVKLSLVAVVAACAAGLISLRALASPESTPRSFVMQQEHYVVQNGNEVLVLRQTESRRSDGARHLEGTYEPQPGGRAATFRRIDLPDGTEAMLIDDIKTKTTGMMKEEAERRKAQLAKEIPANCLSVGDELTGEETLFGFKAFRIRTQASKEALRRNIVWKLPDFHCIIVQVVAEKRESQSSPWIRTNEVRLVSFRAVEPDSRVFDIPSDYEEMKPSDAKRKLSRSQGQTPETCPKCFEDDPADAVYEKRKIK